jgi:GT2 family glycosyltransferase
MPGKGNTARLIAGNRPRLGGYDADIIILSLNRPAETEAAIESALMQQGGIFQVTVLDQGSEAEMLTALSRRFSKALNFSLYAAGTNLGVASGRNLAASLGHGRIIVALDNDAIFKGKWVVARALDRFRQNPDLGALGFSVLSADGVCPDRFSWGYPARLLSRFKEFFDTTTFVGAGHAIRRLTWNMAGGYDPGFFFTWEEYDFCLAAIALNWRICYDGSLEVIHNISPDARITWSAKRMTYFVRNRLIIGRKWGATWVALSPRIAGYLVKAMLNHQFRATVAGIREAFAAEIPKRRKMPKAMRHYVQANETRHRGSWMDRLRIEVFGSMHQDVTSKGSLF